MGSLGLAEPGWATLYMLQLLIRQALIERAAGLPLLLIAPVNQRLLLQLLIYRPPVSSPYLVRRIRKVGTSSFTVRVGVRPL